MIMEVDAVLYIWTDRGMTRSTHGNYIQKDEVERLLEEAHERGRQHGLRQATELTHRSFNDAMKR